jgi:hypothetical protein
MNSQSDVIKASRVSVRSTFYFVTNNNVKIQKNKNKKDVKFYIGPFSGLL